MSRLQGLSGFCLAIFLAACGNAGETTIVREVPAEVEELTGEEAKVSIACIDADGDGYGVACEAGPDCNDADKTVFSSAIAYVDADGDGRDASGPIAICAGKALPASFVETSSGSDCDDASEDRYSLSSAYIDADGDGRAAYGPVQICAGATLPPSYAADISGVSDCDDADGDIFEVRTAYSDPDGDGYSSTRVQICSGTDLPATYLAVSNGADCNEGDGSTFALTTVFADGDGDGYASAGPFQICAGATLPASYAAASTGADCNDSSSAAHTLVTAYTDGDNDGYSSGQVQLCAGATLPAGFKATSSGADCDDGSSSNYSLVSVYSDPDGDGFSSNQTQICAGATLPAGYVAASSGADCDEGDTTAFSLRTAFVDIDTDGYAAGGPVQICAGYSLPVSYTAASIGEDCDDANVASFMTQEGFFDADNDGFAGGSPVSLCTGGTLPNQYYSSAEDCNDADSDNYFSCSSCADADGDGYYEGCDNYSNRQGPDCNDNDTKLYSMYEVFPDQDGDGVSSDWWASQFTCVGDSLPAGFSWDPGYDCDDQNATMWRETDVYRDADGDQYGNYTGYQCVGQLDPGYIEYSLGYDCDDTNASIYQWINGYPDADSDGFTLANSSNVCSDGTMPMSYSASPSTDADCDDRDGSIYPGASETPGDYVDQNCLDGDPLPTDADGIFVSAANGDDSFDGSMASPKATITAALAAANGAGKAAVYVETGDYAEAVDASLLISGGFSANFSMTGGMSTIQAPAIDTPSIDVTAGVTARIAHFSIQPNLASDDVSVVRNFGSLSLQDVVVQAMGVNSTRLTGIESHGDLQLHSVQIGLLATAGEAVGIDANGVEATNLHVDWVQGDQASIGIRNTGNLQLTGSLVANVLSGSADATAVESGATVFENVEIRDITAPNGHAQALDVNGSLSYLYGSIDMSSAGVSRGGIQVNGPTTIESLYMNDSGVAAKYALRVTGDVVVKYSEFLLQSVSAGLLVSVDGSLRFDDSRISADYFDDVTAIVAGGDFNCTNSMLTAYSDSADAAVTMLQVGLGMHEINDCYFDAYIWNSNRPAIGLVNAGGTVTANSTDIYANSNSDAVGIDTTGELILRQWSYITAYGAESATGVIVRGGTVRVETSELSSGAFGLALGFHVLDGNLYVNNSETYAYSQDATASVVWMDDGAPTKLHMSASWSDAYGEEIVGIRSGNQSDTTLLNMQLYGNGNGNAVLLDLSGNAVVAKSGIILDGAGADASVVRIRADAISVRALRNEFDVGTMGNGDCIVIEQLGGMATFTNNLLDMGYTSDWNQVQNCIGYYHGSPDAISLLAHNSIFGAEVSGRSIGFYWSGTYGGENVLLVNNYFNMGESLSEQARTVGLWMADRPETSNPGLMMAGNLFWGDYQYTLAVDEGAGTNLGLFEFNNCLFDGCASGGLNFSTDPLISSWYPWLDYYSPLVDNAADQDVFGFVVFNIFEDFEGAPRPVNGRYDIGALEYNGFGGPM